MLEKSRHKYNLYLKAACTVQNLYHMTDGRFARLVRVVRTQALHDKENQYFASQCFTVFQGEEN